MERSTAFPMAYRLALTIFAAALLLAPCEASAVRIDVTPAISLDQVYDSNVFNSSVNEKDDFIFRATPALTLSFRFPETTLNLRSSITLDRYYEFSELNSDDSAITLALDSMPPIAVTSRLSLAPTAFFVQARNSFQRTQLVPTGDPLVPVSVAAESVIQRTRDYGAALRINFLVTPKTEFSIGGGYTQRDFLDNTTTGVDSEVFRVDTSVAYRFTQNFSSGIFFNATRNTFENERESDVFATGLTGSYRISAEFTIDARAGASYMEETLPGGIFRNYETSPYGFLSLVYLVPNRRVALTGTMEQAGGGGFGETTRRETVSLSVTDQFAERWIGDIIGVYQASHSLQPGVDADASTGSVTGRVRYQILEWLDVHLSGTAFRQRGNGGLVAELERYSAFFGFTVGRTFNVY